MVDTSAIVVLAMRCFGEGDQLYEHYHDHEWGRPIREERALLERLCLEGFQSGLSWLTILRKRDNFRLAFADFDPEVVATYGPGEIDELLGNTGIIRHRGKIEATVTNARAALELRDGGVDLGELIWSARPSLVGQKDDGAKTIGQTASLTPESVVLAKQLKAHGFRFVGATTAYSLMQACGVVNDHTHSCPVRKDVERERAAFLATK